VLFEASHSDSDSPESSPADNADEGRKTVLVAPANVGSERQGAGRKTVILDTPSKGSSEPAEGAHAAGVQGKLVGWLVSFDWNPNGQDFRLFMGKTRIGNSSDMDIVLPDGMVSGFHAEVLHRGGELKIRDNFSTNGTFVNDEDLGDVPRKLCDGDTIRIGRTHLKLRLIDTEEAS